MSPEDTKIPSLDEAPAASASASSEVTHEQAAQEFMFKMILVDALRGAGFPAPETAALAVRAGLATYEESRVLMPHSNAPIIGKGSTGAGAPFTWQLRPLMALPTAALQDLYISVKEGQIKYAAMLREAAQAVVH